MNSRDYFRLRLLSYLVDAAFAAKKDLGTNPRSWFPRVEVSFSVRLSDTEMKVIGFLSKTQVTLWDGEMSELHPIYEAFPSLEV